MGVLSGGFLIWWGFGISFDESTFGEGSSGSDEGWGSPRLTDNSDRGLRAARWEFGMGREHRKFTADFKVEAVQLDASSGDLAAHVARDPGIN